MSSVRPSANFVQQMRFNRWVAVACLITAAVSLIYSNAIIRSERSENDKRAYFITKTSTSVGEVIRVGDEELLQLEIKHHISLFGNCMWTFDQYSFWDQIEKGVNLSGSPGTRLYQQYKNANFFEELRALNGRSKLIIDNIEVIDSTYEPYKARLYARTIYETPTEIKQKRLIAYVELSEVSRSEENVHGFLVTTFNIEDNSEIAQR